MPFAERLFTVDGLPAHPLLVAAVAVLLPLAAVCGVAISLHRGLRRRYGLAVLVLTGVAVLAVPFAQATGRQLADRLGPPDPVLARHEALGNQLLPFALGFGVAVLFLAVAGRLADRERTATEKAEQERPEATLNSTDIAVRPVSTTWRRLSVLASVLVIGLAVVTTVDVVRIGTTGAASVWQGVVKRQIR
jgi:hypothetical protein